jgi:hypothetical protein
VCPEPICVHHDPARALGDLTGIKKHFCRKHGEKKWKCDRCSKKYAVQSDWKAHSKTCGSREYRCDCGTVFSREREFGAATNRGSSTAEAAASAAGATSCGPHGSYSVPLVEVNATLTHVRPGMLVLVFAMPSDRILCYCLKHATLSH